MSDASSTQPKAPLITLGKTMATGAIGTAAGIITDYVYACMAAGHLTQPGYAIAGLMVTVVGVPLHMLYNAAIYKLSTLKGATQ